MAAGQSPWRLQIGERVDHFRVLRPIGRGGMGEVYAAQDERLGRQVALKLLTRLEDEKHALAEARATARFSHPHIVTLHEVGSHEGRLYLALELLEGHTLQARLREGRLALPEALRIARDVALAVEEAHAHEVHHRDLKPANVFLATDGRLRVLDFGLAELASEARDVRGEGLRGTPAYMAPEQWQKAPSTAAADVWALGIMLHEALAGAHPCPRRDPAALRRWSSDPSLRSLEELPEAVEALIEACLRPEPSQRPRATELVAQLSGLLASSPFESALPSPFKGLLAFTEADAGRFRGREKEVTTFVERLRNTPTLAILGPSGAGKSSFVRAGVIPRLREFGPLRVIEVRPGRRPLASLAEALDRAETTTVRSMTASLDSVEASSSAASLSRGPLPDPPAEDDLVPGRVASRLRELAERVEGRILVLVDQLEELVVLAESAEERRAFMATLAAAADDANTPVRVVYTLREEFSSRIVNAAESSAALSQVVVLRDPSPSELRRVLFEPVAAAGYAFDDPTVVDAMIEEVRGRQASLPLLQFAGARLWEARDREGQRLLRAEYDAMGGVAGALAHQADEILSTLGPDEMVMGRSLWLRLVTPERTRRSLPRDDLVAGLGEVGEALLGQFMEARLIVTRRTPGEEGEDLEMVHEALIERWSRLAAWIAQSSEELAILAEVERASARWLRQGRRDVDLWGGDALRDAERALAGYLGEVPERARRFLELSTARESRARWRARATVGVVIAALGVAAIVFAAGQRTAERQRLRAETQRAQAELEGARAALLRGRPLEARAKLRSSLEAADSVGGRWLWRALRSETREWRQDAPSYFFLADFAPDERHLAVSSSRALLVLDVQTKTRLHVLPVSDVIHRGLRFSPDGRWLASSFRYGELSLWDLSHETPERRILRDEGEGTSRVQWLEDGTLLVLHGRTLQTWRPGQEELQSVRVFAEGDGAAFAVGDSPQSPLVRSSSDGILVSASVHGSPELIALDGAVSALDLSPEDDRVVVGKEDGTVEVWDLRLRRQSWQGRGHARRVRHVEFDPTGRRFLSVALDGVVLWRDGERAAERSFDCDERAFSANFDRTGKRLAIVCREGSLRVHRLDVTPIDEHVGGHGTETMGPSIDPSGRFAASGGADFAARLWTLAEGRPASAPLRHRSSVWTTTFSPDGSLLATGQQNGDVRLWDVWSRRTIRTLAGLGAGVNWIEFVGDGVIAGDTEGAVRSWTLSSEGSKPPVPPCPTEALSLDARGRSAFACTTSPRVLVMNSRGEIEAEWRHEVGVVTVKWVGSNHVLLEDVEGAFWRWGLQEGPPHSVQPVPGQQSLIGSHVSAELAVFSGVEGGLHIVGPRLRSDYPSHDRFTNMSAFDREGQLLLTTGGDGALRAWTVIEGERLWGLRGYSSGAPALLLGPRGWLDLSTVPAQPHRFPAGTPAWVRDPPPERRVVGAGQLYCLNETAQLRMAALDLGRERVWNRVEATEVWPARGACVARTEDGVYRFPLNGERQRLAPSSAEVRHSGDTLWRTDGERAQPLDATLPAVPLEAPVAAVVRVGRWLAAGYVDGRLGFINLATGRRRDPFQLESAPLTTVSQLIRGPDDTLVAGYRDGAVRVWDSQSGALLLSEQLNGRIEALAVDGPILVAFTDVGGFGRWGLEPVLEDRCTRLRKVWQDIPVVWETEALIRRPPPARHPCAPPP